MTINISYPYFSAFLTFKIVKQISYSIVLRTFTQIPSIITKTIIIISFTSFFNKEENYHTIC